VKKYGRAAAFRLRVCFVQDCGRGGERTADFGIAPGDPIYVIDRVRLADGVPMALESIQILFPLPESGAL